MLGTRCGGGPGSGKNYVEVLNDRGSRRGHLMSGYRIALTPSVMRWLRVLYVRLDCLSSLYVGVHALREGSGIFRSAMQISHSARMSRGLDSLLAFFSLAFSRCVFSAVLSLLFDLLVARRAFDMVDVTVLTRARWALYYIDGVKRIEAATAGFCWSGMYMYMYAR